MNTKLRVRLLQSAAVATPVVAIVIFKMVSGSTPDSTNAATATPAPTAATAAAPIPAATPEQQRAKEWAGKQSPSTPVASPLTPPEARHTQVPGEQPAAPVTPRVVGVEYSLTSVLKARDSAIAAINGKLYKIGDQVKPGATLVAVDTVKFTARIQRADGSFVDLSCDAAKPAPQKRPAQRPSFKQPSQGAAPDAKSGT